MATQFVTYHLSSYSQVIDKSKAIQAVEGEVVIVKVKPESFDDYGKENNNYMLVAKLPMSAAIRLC